ncbi:MAG TPA: Clp protease N-terminal domain-containing protein [Terracidiphilus sp.]|nr:Clp protease N-terminal domain-containing protein [Terracidiphilus sp.]
MFERYTEKSRRVIFFARYEASQFGQPFIETEHLLLGLLREDKALTNRILRSHASVESIRKQIAEHTEIREKVSTSVDLPLSNEGKRVLAYAAEEAERLGHKHIGTEHLLLGLLREEKCFAAELLKERGVKLESVREELARVMAEGRGPELGDASPVEFSRDLTQAAMDGELTAAVGRGEELEGIIEVLGYRRRANPLLIGERGAGKAAIVEALAQRIADGAVPPFLAEKRIFVFDVQRARRLAKEQSREQLNLAMKAIGESAGSAIFFIGELRSLLSPTSEFFGLTNATGILKSSPLQGKVQCIATSTPSDYEECIRMTPWLDDSFHPVYVRPLGEEDTLKVLEAHKVRYEKLHEVSYSEEALQAAVQLEGRYFPQRVLPGKALDLLDAAAARVKLRQGIQPEEITEVQKRIHFIAHRAESAILNHEFEKARFYSEEEKKERENLRVLREKYPESTPPSVVGRQDVEAVIARWAAYPFRP